MVEVAEFSELRNKPKETQSFEPVSFEQLRSKREPVFGVRVTRQVPLTERIKPVLEGLSKIEDVLPADQRKAMKGIIEKSDDPEGYRSRITASMLLAEQMGKDYKFVNGDLDNIIKTKFGKKMNAAQVVSQLSPYKPIPTLAAGKEQGFFARAWETITGGPDIGYYEGTGRFSKRHRHTVRSAVARGFLGTESLQDQSEFERKSAGKAVKDGISQAGTRMARSLAGGAQLAGEAANGLDRYNTGRPDEIAEWGRLMAEAADVYYEENPDEAMQLQGNTGLVGTTIQFFKRPELLVQGLVETAPMLMEAYLGHVTGTKAAKLLGTGAKALPWAGRVTAIGGDTFGNTYADARKEGTEPGDAFARATLTALGEGVVEEFTLGKKVAVFKGAAGQAAKRRIASSATDILLGARNSYTRGFLEEGTQQVNDNFWRMVFTDTEPLKQDFIKRASEGVPSAAATGGIMETVMTGGFGGFGKSMGFVSDRVKVARVRSARKTINENPNLTDVQKNEINAFFDKTELDVLAGKWADRGKNEASKAFADDVKTAFNLNEKQSVGITALIDAGSAKMGLTPDQWLNTFVKGVEVGTPETIKKSIEQEAVEVFGQNMDEQETQRPADKDGVPILDNIWYRNKLKSETRKAMLDHPAYKATMAKGDYSLSDYERSRLKAAIVEEVKRDPVYQIERDAIDQMRSEIDTGVYYVPETLKGEVQGMIETYPGLRFNITHDADKGLDWTKAVQEGLGRNMEGLDETSGEMDISEFLERVGQAIADKKGASEQILEKMHRSGNPYSEIVAVKLEMIEQGETPSVIDDRISDIARTNNISTEGLLLGDILNRETMAAKVVNPAILTAARQSGNFDFEVAATKYDLIHNGVSVNEINKQIVRAARANNIPAAEARKLWLKSHSAYKTAAKRARIQKRKAQVEFAADGKAVIRAFEGADFSSVVHELGHIFRRTLDKKSLRAAERWAGIYDAKWTEEAEEKFARGFERYLWNGKAPNSNMSGVFEQFKEWMRKIYTSLANSPIDVEITSEMRRVFDNLLSVREIHPGEMTFEEFFAKSIREVQDPAMEWHKRYNIHVGETPKKSWQRLKKEWKARQDKELSGGGGGDDDVDLSNLTDKQAASIWAMETSEIKPKARSVAKNMSLTIEELLAENDNDDRVITETRNQLADAYSKGRAEGLSRATKKFRTVIEGRQARKQLREYIQELGRKIGKRIPATVDLAYREAIAALQAGIDPSFRSKSTIADRERLRKFIAENPDAKMPAKLVDTITKKALNELTINELEELAAERDKLEKLGRKKKQLKLEQEMAQLDDIAGQLTSQIQGQIKTKTKTVKPDQIDPDDIDIVEAGTDGDSRLYNVSYKGQQVVDYTGEELQAVVFRLAEGETTDRIRDRVKEGLLREAKEPVTSSTRKGGTPKKLWHAIRAFSLRPSRIFDMFDGGKGAFDGLMHKTFYDAVNVTWDAELRMVDARIKAGDEKLAELGLTLKDMAETRVVNGIKYSTQEIMGIYGYSLNYKSKLALFFGNDLTQKTVMDVVYHCENEDPRLGELVRWIVGEFDQHFDRLDEAFVAVQERGAFDDEDFAKLQDQRDEMDNGIKLAGLGKEENYLPMRRQELDYTPDARQILNEMLERSMLKKGYAEKGFTIRRQDIPVEFQKPIKLDLWSMWIEQVNRQEHFIHQGKLTADLHRILNNKSLQEAVTDAFGNEFNKAARDYVSRVANPNIYKSYGYWGNLSRTLRSNAAISYLAYNVVTMLKQLPSLLYYLPDAGMQHIGSSLAEFTTHPLKTIKKVRELDPQVANPAINRVMEELKQNNNNAYQKIVQKIGVTGMKGILAMDAVARTIGWNAVYEKTLAEGESQAEAIRRAQNATLRTQPAAASKDVAAMYTQNEALNWVLMFSNQLSNMYNVATYDAPRQAFKNKQVYKAALSMMGIGISGLLMWSLSNRRLPEEPEEFADALASQAINIIPLVGSTITATRQGFGGSGIGAIEDTASIYTATENIVTGDGDEKDWIKLAESMGVLFGVPTVQPKRIIKAISEGDPIELIGGKK